MSKKPILTSLGFVIVLILMVGCNLPTSSTVEIPDTGQQDPTPTNALEPVPTEPVPTATELLIPTDTSQAPPTNPAEPTATTGPQCTVLQGLNFRSGPGTAYNPPIRALEAQTLLEPRGFNPVGIPGGPWVQVFDGSRNDIGWVSAGDQFVSCNIDLNTLPTVQVAPPAPPQPPSTDNSGTDGEFPPFAVIDPDFDSQYFFRFGVYDDDLDDPRDGVGVDQVIFEVTDKDNNSNLVYSRTENQAGFCIFGGGEPTCNPWVFEDFVYKWEPGGARVENGNYQLAVRVIFDNGEEGNWTTQIVLRLN